jgi:LysM repeat protein
MKFRTLPVKRQPVQKGLLKRLSAVTKNTRRQRVSAAAAAEAEHEDSSSKISRALTIIFLFHILAIALYFVHERFLDGKTDPVAGVAEVQRVTPVAAVVQPPARPAPQLSTGERLYQVVAGDNYARIAAAHEVNEAELRALNEHKDIRVGMPLKLPPRRIVAADPPEVVEIRAGTIPERDRGLVEAVPADAPAPRAIPVTAAAAASPGASGERYVVQPGDSVWGIANRFKVDQDALMKANGVTDPRRLRVGATLVIPR